MTRNTIFPLCLASAFSGLLALAPPVSAQSDADSALIQALSGKSFVGKTGMAITLEADGTISGGNDAFQFGGTWTVEDGQYCRTLTEPTPEPMRSSGCLDIVIDGEQATLTSADGTIRTYTLR
ncbi:hypothetical protein [uncultured Aliiroseovarius sp.]|uniref:hypothetical protein n=1 Tax=uncultured Aliiroseovarius sp. TaxID=1658783 RepID=UPI0026047E3F|nr:hypothetical protein [uncultured Aliiroseovarius sp.]